MEIISSADQLPKQNQKSQDHFKDLTFAIVYHRIDKTFLRLINDLNHYTSIIDLNINLILIQNGPNTQYLAPTSKNISIKTLGNLNNSLSAARNLALENVNTKYLLFLDSDCRIHNAWFRQVSEMLVILNKESQVAAVGGASILVGKAIELKTFRMLGKYFNGFEDIPTSTRRNHMPTSFIIYDVKKIKLLGQFNLQFEVAGEDRELSHRINKNGYQILQKAGAWVYHVQKNTFRKFLSRSFIYGAVQGRVILYHPLHLFQKSSLPLFFLLCLSATPFVLRVNFIESTIETNLYFNFLKIAATVLALSFCFALLVPLGLKLKIPMIQKASKTTKATTLCVMSVLCYGIGTIVGLVYPRILLRTQRTALL